MFANLTVTTGEPASVLTVPRTAIVYSLYGDNVFVVRAAPHAREQGGVSDKGGASGLIVERRFVKVGPARGERIAVEEGLRAGERVVTAGPDQAAGLYAGHDRRNGRASAAHRNATAVTDSPMNAFTDLFIRRPVLATVVSLLILLVGGMAAFRLQVRQFPETSNTTITITTTYPGAAADVIKGFITTPIEQAVASAEGIDTLVSTSQQNTSTITLNLRLDANPDRAMADTLSKVNQVRGLLPRDANDPVVVKQTGQGFALMYLSFNSEVMTPSQITDYLTRVVQPRLQTVDGVANAQILGGQTFAMRIWLDPTRMASLGVTPNDVRAALAANNFTTAAGEVKGDYTQISVNALTSLDSAKAFGQLVIATHGDALVRLGDVSKIELGPQSVEFLVGLRWPQGRVRRHLWHARGQSADRDQWRARDHAEHPGAVADGPESHDRLRFDHLHPRLDL